MMRRVINRSWMTTLSSPNSFLRQEPLTWALTNEVAHAREGRYRFTARIDSSVQITNKYRPFCARNDYSFVASSPFRRTLARP